MRYLEYSYNDLGECEKRLDNMSHSASPEKQRSARCYREYGNLYDAALERDDGVCLVSLVHDEQLWCNSGQKVTKKGKEFLQKTVKSGSGRVVPVEILPMKGSPWAQEWDVEHLPSDDPRYVVSFRLKFLKCHSIFGRLLTCVTLVWHLVYAIVRSTVILRRRRGF